MHKIKQNLLSLVLCFFLLSTFMTMTVSAAEAPSVSFEDGVVTIENFAYPSSASNIATFRESALSADTGNVVPLDAEITKFIFNNCTTVQYLKDIRLAPKDYDLEFNNCTLNSSYITWDASYGHSLLFDGCSFTGGSPNFVLTGAVTVNNPTITMRQATVKLNNGATLSNMDNSSYVVTYIITGDGNTVDTVKSASPGNSSTLNGNNNTFHNIKWGGSAQSTGNNNSFTSDIGTTNWIISPLNLKGDDNTVESWKLTSSGYTINITGNDNTVNGIISNLTDANSTSSSRATVTLTGDGNTVTDSHIYSLTINGNEATVLNNWIAYYYQYGITTSLTDYSLSTNIKDNIISGQFQSTIRDSVVSGNTVRAQFLYYGIGNIIEENSFFGNLSLHSSGDTKILNNNFNTALLDFGNGNGGGSANVGITMEGNTTTNSNGKTRLLSGFLWLEGCSIDHPIYYDSRLAMYVNSSTLTGWTFGNRNTDGTVNSSEIYNYSTSFIGGGNIFKDCDFKSFLSYVDIVDENGNKNKFEECTINEEWINYAWLNPEGHLYFDEWNFSTSVPSRSNYLCYILNDLQNTSTNGFPVLKIANSISRVTFDNPKNWGTVFNNVSTTTVTNSQNTLNADFGRYKSTFIGMDFASWRCGIAEFNSGSINYQLTFEDCIIATNPYRCNTSYLRYVSFKNNCTIYNCKFVETRPSSAGVASLSIRLYNSELWNCTPLIEVPTATSAHYQWALGTDYTSSIHDLEIPYGYYVNLSASGESTISDISLVDYDKVLPSSLPICTIQGSGTITNIDCANYPLTINADTSCNFSDIITTYDVETWGYCGNNSISSTATLDNVIFTGGSLYGYWTANSLYNVSLTNCYIPNMVWWQNLRNCTITGNTFRRGYFFGYDYMMGKSATNGCIVENNTGEHLIVYDEDKGELIFNGLEIQSTYSGASSSVDQVIGIELPYRNPAVMRAIARGMPSSLAVTRGHYNSGHRVYQRTFTHRCSGIDRFSVSYASSESVGSGTGYGTGQYGYRNSGSWSITWYTSSSALPTNPGSKYFELPSSTGLGNFRMSRFLFSPQTASYYYYKTKATDRVQTNKCRYCGYEDKRTDYTSNGYNYYVGWGYSVVNNSETVLKDHNYTKIVFNDCYILHPGFISDDISFNYDFNDCTFVAACSLNNVSSVDTEINYTGCDFQSTGDYTFNGNFTFTDCTFDTLPNRSSSNITHTSRVNSLIFATTRDLIFSGCKVNAVQTTFNVEGELTIDDSSFVNRNPGDSRTLTLNTNTANIDFAGLTAWDVQTAASQLTLGGKGSTATTVNFTTPFAVRSGSSLPTTIELLGMTIHNDTSNPQQYYWSNQLAKTFTLSDVRFDQNLAHNFQSGNYNFSNIIYFGPTTTLEFGMTTNTLTNSVWTAADITMKDTRFNSSSSQINADSVSMTDINGTLTSVTMRTKDIELIDSTIAGSYTFAGKGDGVFEMTNNDQASGSININGAYKTIDITKQRANTTALNINATVPKHTNINLVSDRYATLRGNTKSAIVIDKGSYNGNPAVSVVNCTVEQGSLTDTNGTTTPSRYNLGDNSRETDTTTGTQILRIIELSNPPIEIDWGDFPGFDLDLDLKCCYWSLQDK